MIFFSSKVKSQKSKVARMRGISIIESMIALGLLTVGFLGAMQLVSSSISANRVIADQYIGSYLAVEGIEVVKNLIDANKTQGNPWLQDILFGDVALDHETVLTCISPACTSPCSSRPQTLCPYGSGRNLLFDQTAGTYYADLTGPPNDPNLSRFNRRVTINDVSAGGVNEVEVISRVSWVTRGNAQFSIDIYDHFFDWRP